MNKITRIFLLLLNVSLFITGCGEAVDNHSEKEVLSASNTVPSIIREPVGNLSHEYAKHRKNQVTSIDYDLSLILDAKRDYFQGKSTIRFEMAVGNRSPLTVDFDSGTINAILVNDKPVKWEYNQWFITLAPQLFKDGNNRIEIEYSRPYAKDGFGLHRFKEEKTENVYVYTHFEPYKAHRLFPHFDQPNLRATYTIDVVAPSDWSVITSVLESKVEEQGENKHWYFPRSANFSSYILPLHAGPYKVWYDKAGDIPLRLFARQRIAPYVKLDEWFTPTKQSFEFFQKYFDIKYPFIKYDQVISPDYNIGAMENVAAVTFNESYIKRGEKTRAQKLGLANIIAHEMAHMWFGDLVTMDWWNGLWLKESFATYMANLALSEATEYTEVWDTFYARTEQWAYRSDQAVTTHAIELPVLSTADAYTNFDGITYGKGASVLRQLPFYLGEEAFRKGVSNYLKKYSYQATTLTDFMIELGNAAEIDLTEWQQQWLYTAGLNTITAQYQCESGKIKQMSVEQMAPENLPTLRTQRVQIGLFNLVDGEMSLTNAIPVTYSGKNTQIETAPGLTCPDAVYPNYDDWGYVKVELDNATIITLNQHINKFESTKVRLMMWQSLWDSVLDAKLPVTEYIDFAIKNIDQEEDNNTVNSVARGLISSFHYIESLAKDSTLRTKYKNKIEAFMLQKTLNAPPGSDHQKEWFNRFLDAAHTKKGLTEVSDLLIGDTSLEGLKIDQDRRWLLISKLNQYQFGDYKALLDAEKLRDTSDKGVKNAIASEVIRPDSKNKQKWLDILINEPEKYKLSTSRNIIWSLFPSSQKEFRAHFSKQISKAIPKLNQSAEQAYVSEFSSSLAPTLCTSDSVDNLVQLNKEFTGFNPSIIKAFKIAHQEDQRCVDIIKLLTSATSN